MLKQMNFNLVAKIILSKEQQDEIQSIIAQTSLTHHNYTDSQIDHLLNPNYIQKDEFHSKTYGKTTQKHSIYSQLSLPSESQQNHFLSREPSFGSQDNKIGLKNQSINIQSSSDQQEFNYGIQGYFQDDQLTEEQDINQTFINYFKCDQQASKLQKSDPQQRLQKLKNRKNFPFKSIYEQIQKLQRPFTLQQVQKEYPSFMLTKPTYQIESTARERNIALGNVFLQTNVVVFDVGFSQKQKFWMAAVTSKNSLIIYEIDSAKAIKINDIVKTGQQVGFIKWSKSLKYLIFSTNQMQLKLLQLEDISFDCLSENEIYFMNKTSEIFTLQQPKIKRVIIQCYFIEQTPLKILLIDNEYEIYILEMKKQFLSPKPHITKIPIKFSPFFQIRFEKIYGDNGNVVTLLIVGAEQYVTFAIIQPKFQVILVYSKQQHFPQAQKPGYPNILFVNRQVSPIISSPEILIVWDRNIQLIKLKIQQFDPFTYNIQTLLKYELPDSTVLFGNLSDTLFYQLTKDELKIYSIYELMNYNMNFSKEKKDDDGVAENRKFAECLFRKKISLEDFAFGEQIKGIARDEMMDLRRLRRIRGAISQCSNNLFIYFQEQIYSVSIISFSSYIEHTIDSISDWKVGLQLLNDCILSTLTIFDNIKHNYLKKQLKQYSIRYIEFLSNIIPNIQIHNQIWKQQMCFLFRILICCKEEKFLLKDVLVKLVRISKVLLRNYQPFILAGMLTDIEPDTLDLLLAVLRRDLGRRMIYAFKNSIHQDSRHELPHLINNILIRYDLYLELIWINQYFSDFYTPFVILLSKFQKDFSQRQTQFVENFENNFESQNHCKPESQIIEKQIIKFNENKNNFTQLLSFLTFDTFRLINASQYKRLCVEQQKFHISKVKAKQLLQTLIPLMRLKLSKILIQRSCEQFFDLILQELFYGNCLDVLNELNDQFNKTQQKVYESNRSFKNLVKEIVDDIPFKLVIECEGQGNYWIFMIRGMIRKLISIRIFPGLYYLTIEHSQQSMSLVSLVNFFSKQCSRSLNQELYSIEIQKKMELFEKIKNTEYVQLLKVLGEHLKRQMEVLQCLINCKKCHNVELIDYMNQILLKASSVSATLRQQTLSSMKSLLKRNIKLFTQIDPEKTSNFIIQNYKHEMKQFISYLQDNPKEQLNLLKQILNHYSYGQFLNNQKKKYLELLAITGQHQQILYELKSHMFPLDEAMEICKKYQILNPWAFLLVKSGGTGNSILAIQIYFKLINHHIENYKYNRKTHQKWLQLKKLLQEQLTKCIQVCIQLDIRTANHQETEWFLIIQQLEALRKHIHKTCSPDVESAVKQIIINFLYPQLIRELLEQVPIQITLSYLRKSLTELQSSTSQLIIQQMIKACISQKQILKNAQQQVSHSEITQRKTILEQTLKGFVTLNKCHQCMEQDINTKIHYCCGHDIHPSCNQDVKECICCKADEEKMIWRLVNLKDKVEKVIYYNSLDPTKDKSPNQIIRLSRQEKLKKYDQLQQGFTIVFL